MAEVTQSVKVSGTVDPVSRRDLKEDARPRDVAPPTMAQMGRVASTEVPVHPVEHVALAETPHCVADYGKVDAVTGGGVTEDAPPVSVASDAVNRVARGGYRAYHYFARYGDASCCGGRIP